MKRRLMHFFIHVSTQWNSRQTCVGPQKKNTYERFSEMSVSFCLFLFLVADGGQQVSLDFTTPLATTQVDALRVVKVHVYIYICKCVFYSMCFPKTNPFQRGLFEDSRPATLTTKQSDLAFEGLRMLLFIFRFRYVRLYRVVKNSTLPPLPKHQLKDYTHPSNSKL